MLNVSQKKKSEKLFNGYMDKIEGALYSRKPYLSIYRDLLEIRKEYKNDEACISELSAEMRKKISSFLGWTLNIYKDLAHLKFNKTKIFVDKIKSKQR